MVFNKRLLYILVSLCFLLQGCPIKGLIPCKSKNRYNFEAVVKFKPSYSSYNIGDTLWFEGNIPFKLLDVVVNDSVDYSHAKYMGTLIRVFKIDSISNGDPIHSAQDFDYFSVWGREYADEKQSNWIRQIECATDGKSYIFKIGIILQKKGVYALFIANAVNVQKDIEGNCDRANYAISLANDSTNLYMYENYLGYAVQSDYVKQGYCFMVK
jgi:hypothetical protein